MSLQETQKSYIPPKESDAINTVPDTTEANRAQGAVDGVVLAFLYLLDAASVTANTALVHSKRLQQNALAQEGLNHDAIALGRIDIPKEIINHHSKRVTHWSWEFWKHKGFEYWTIQTWNTYPNQGAIQAAESQNHQITFERQVISSKVSSLQLDAKTEETGLNTTSDEAMQAIQEGGKLMQVLQDLSFAALLRHPPN